MFYEADPVTNGELSYFLSIMDECKTVMEVGGRTSTTIFTRFPGLGHYFDSNTERMQILQALPNSNYQAVFNTGECRGEDYIMEQNIDYIDFLKIQTRNASELTVLQGFGEELWRVQRVQFAYGQPYKAAGKTLAKVIHFLQSEGFGDFALLSKFSKPIPMFLPNVREHYHDCNIICQRKEP